MPQWLRTFTWRSCREPRFSFQKSEEGSHQSQHKFWEIQLPHLASVLGWVLIAAVIFLLLVFKCVSRCFSPVSYLQLKFWEIYLEKEKQILQSQAAEHATQLARENIRSFFECSKPKECNTPSRKDWQQISALYTFNSKNQFYSMLHKYVSRKEVSSSLHSVEGDVVVPVLGFVDDAAMANTHGV
ncbi:similar to chromosome 6 open reading frame 188, isoform CRA_a [Rattus norvegicus]|uniref:Similar to chromosome 6 open reading frame 188, isoform CRA_a n=1 Tax=Rattus norvegicus TaxID=10116 RepID=A6K3S7_RAT|nr:similar to chromosome 6 open reading frame 188, isoform CRA_a [Rattus norvegicus]